MLKKFKSSLDSFLSLSKELFIFSLIFYGILFVLETLFPGFVSYNFNLNWVLLLVFVLGIFFALSPSSSSEDSFDKGDKIKPFDYFLALFLTVAGAEVIFYKVELGGYLHWLVSITSGILIFILSLVILIPRKEKEELVYENETEIFSFGKDLKFLRVFLNQILEKKESLSVAPFLIFLILCIFLIPKNLDNLAEFLSKGKEVREETYPAPQPPFEPEFWDDFGWPMSYVEPSKDILIRVLNGGIEKNSARNFSEALKEAGFKKVVFGDADNFQYKNTIIRFRPEDKEQENIVKKYLRQKYVTISEVPSGTTSAQIDVILGSEEFSELEEGIIFEQE